MKSMSSARRSLGAVAGVAVSAALALGVGASVAQADSGRHPAHDSSEKPTVVLVHGAFADASGWGGVIEKLERDGYPVLAVANPCVAWRPTRRTCAASSTRSTATWCWSATPTAAA
nr:hypothetical protein GCM10025730_02020 [Promicromonospora thailandica]